MTKAERRSSWASWKLDLLDAMSKDPEVQPTDFVVAFRYLQHALDGERRLIFVAQATVAEELGITERAVRKAVKRLRDLDWVTIKKVPIAKKHGTRNFYTFRHPDHRNHSAGDRDGKSNALAADHRNETVKITGTTVPPIERPYVESPTSIENPLRDSLTPFVNSWGRDSARARRVLETVLSKAVAERFHAYANEKRGEPVFVALAESFAAHFTKLAATTGLPPDEVATMMVEKGWTHIDAKKVRAESKRRERAEAREEERAYHQALMDAERERRTRADEDLEEYRQRYGDGAPDSINGHAPPPVTVGPVHQQRHPPEIRFEQQPHGMVAAMQFEANPTMQ